MEGTVQSGFFIAALDLEPIAVDVPEPLRALRLELERSIYRNPAWTESR